MVLSNVNQALLRQELEQTFASHETDALDSFQFAAAEESTAQAAYILARNADRRRLEGLQQDRQQVAAAQNKLVGIQQQVRGQIATLVAEIQREEMLAEQRAEDARLARERAAAAAAAAQQAAAAAAQAAAERAAQEVALQQQEQQQATQAAQQAEQARQAADVQANTSAVESATTTTVPAETSSAPSIPASSSAAATAVAAAESRVGDPYVWGAAGPDEFDCSGLVMWAYEQAGISLPHYSGAQFADTTQVSMSDLEPGDLVFPANPGEHVAMYVGNGEIVQAPYTGADVQIVPLDPGFFVLATQVG